VTLQLAQHGRRRIAGELRASTGVEAVDRLDQTEARDLQQIVERLVRVGVTSREVARQRQEQLRELLARGPVAPAVVAEQEFALRRSSRRTVA
jgi:hypothetical protein